jgi:hypothetical protein
MRERPAGPKTDLIHPPPGPAGSPIAEGRPGPLFSSGGPDLLPALPRPADCPPGRAGNPRARSPSFAVSRCPSVTAGDPGTVNPRPAGSPGCASPACQPGCAAPCGCGGICRLYRQLAPRRWRAGASCRSEEFGGFGLDLEDDNELFLRFSKTAGKGDIRR